MPKGKPPMLARARGVYREKGVAGLWFGTLSKAGYRRLVLLEKRLDEPTPQWSPGVEAKIRPLLPADETAFEALAQCQPGAFRHRLGLGHQCWGAWVSGQLRHFAWLARGEAWVEYLRCRLSLDDGVLYSYNAYTDPGYRELGLSAARQSACLPSLRAQGQRAVLAAVLPDNPWGLPNCLKLGYRGIGIVRAIGLGPRPWVFARIDRARAPGPGFRFERALRASRP